MLFRPTLLAIAALTWSCHADVRTRCDPYRTPHLIGPRVPAGEEKSVHAPFAAGDCWACHLPNSIVNGEPVADMATQVIRPVNQHCVACHRELFRAPPKHHPPEQAFCTSCHDPHRARQRSLLRDEDTSRACLDYDPPYVAKTAPVATRRRSGP